MEDLNKIERRMLIIDDNNSIFDVFKSIFAVKDQSSSALSKLKADIFDEKEEKPGFEKNYKLDFALSGKEGLEKVKQAISEQNPYMLLFVDMCMPNGWDGLETIENVWKVDETAQVVISTAYSSYSWKDIINRFGRKENLLILKKPFESVEVAQLASALTEKWVLNKQASYNVSQLESMVEEKSKTLKDANAKLVGEIDQRKVVEQKLNVEMKANKEYLDVAEVILLVMDKDQNVRLINRKGCEILQLPADKIIGTNWFDNFVPEGERETIRSIISKMFAAEIDPPHYFENNVVSKDGEKRIIAWRNTTLYDADGNIDSVLSSGEDITLRKITEEKQTKLLEELESVNGELKDFAYIISHDLKAPLRGINTLVGWLVSDYADKLDDEGRKQMDLLQSRVNRMHNMIDGVLQYSRVGRVKEDLKEVDMEDLIEEIIDSIAAPENIEINVKSKLPTMYFEPTRMMQLFQNILSNAVKYMDKPKGLIEIDCEENGDFYQFSIADNGPGISEKDHEKIFQIFQTLGKKDSYESTGVGLSVVKKIVELYGGKIWIESQEGQGCTFIFTLRKKLKETHPNERVEANIAG